MSSAKRNHNGGPLLLTPSAEERIEAPVLPLYFPDTKPHYE